MPMRHPRFALLCLSLMLNCANAPAADYVLDTEGMHASIQFRIRHLGYSWLNGRFNDFDGTFRYHPDYLEDASIQVTINTASVDSNHSERDKQLRGRDFLQVSEYPQASFVSTRIQKISDEHFYVIGDLTLRGVSREIQIETQKVGEGPDPDGGYRVGFSGLTRLVLRDFGITKFLGKDATTVDLLLDIEGVRQK